MLAPFYPSLESPARRSVFAGLRDSFGGSTLNARWSTYKPAALAAATVGSGRVRLEPQQGGTGADGAFWYSAGNGDIGVQQHDGFLLHQALGPAAGTPIGFDVRARIQVRNAADSGNPPADVGAWRFGGLAVHNPNRSSFLKYVHMALGTEGGAGVAGLECKANRVNATGGASVFPVAPLVGDLIRDVRIVRRMTDTQVFDLYDRAVAGSLASSSGWTRRYSIVWTDGEDAGDDFPACPQETDDPFPDDVQVGLICYSNATEHDILLDCFDFWAGPTND